MDDHFTERISRLLGHLSIHSFESGLSQHYVSANSKGCFSAEDVLGSSLPVGVYDTKNAVKFVPIMPLELNSCTINANEKNEDRCFWKQVVYTEP